MNRPVRLNGRVLKLQLGCRSAVRADKRIVILSGNSVLVLTRLCVKIYIYIYIYIYVCVCVCIYIYIYRVSQEECEILRESVP